MSDHESTSFKQKKCVEGPPVPSVGPCFPPAPLPGYPQKKRPAAPSLLTSGPRTQWHAILLTHRQAVLVLSGTLLLNALPISNTYVI